MILQLAFVLTAIIIGARLGGIGLGVMGRVGLGILTFVFGLQPSAPPIDVISMIAAVISAASCMQAAGGLHYMVKLAEHLLRKNPSHVTLLSPLVTYLFTFIDVYKRQAPIMDGEKRSSSISHGRTSTPTRNRMKNCSPIRALILSQRRQLF